MKKIHLRVKEGETVMKKESDNTEHSSVKSSMLVVSLQSLTFPVTPSKTSLNHMFHLKKLCILHI